MFVYIFLSAGVAIFVGILEVYGEFCLCIFVSNINQKVRKIGELGGKLFKRFSKRQKNKH